jgi:hypothetical protein
MLQQHKILDLHNFKSLTKSIIVDDESCNNSNDNFNRKITTANIS